MHIGSNIEHHIGCYWYPPWPWWVWLVTGLVSGFLILLNAVLVLLFVLNRWKRQKAYNEVQYVPNNLVGLPRVSIRDRDYIGRSESNSPGFDLGYLYLADNKQFNWIPEEDYLTDTGYESTAARVEAKGDQFHIQGQSHKNGVVRSLYESDHSPGSDHADSFLQRNGALKYPGHYDGYDAARPNIQTNFPAVDNWPWMSRNLTGPPVPTPTKYSPGNILENYGQKSLSYTA